MYYFPTRIVFIAAVIQQLHKNLQRKQQLVPLKT